MGAGILPATLIKGKLHFLFGKENQYEDSAPGFSDFGGGIDGKETKLQAAIREGREETTGFLGTESEIRRMLKRTYNIDLTNGEHRTHIFFMEYDPMLERYYNNNQRFIQEKLSKEIIKSVKIFEKAEIRWICVDDLVRKKQIFRHYYRDTIQQIYNDQREILSFIKGSKTRKNR